MIVTAWNNGTFSSDRSGYGFVVTRSDRAMYFARWWNSILLTAPGLIRVESINIDNSLFKSGSKGICVSRMFGEWLASCGCEQWPVGKPPQAILLHYENNCFNLIDTVDSDACSQATDSLAATAGFPLNDRYQAQSGASREACKQAAGYSGM